MPPKKIHPVPQDGINSSAPEHAKFLPYIIRVRLETGPNGVPKQDWGKGTLVYNEQKGYQYFTLETLVRELGASEDAIARERMRNRNSAQKTLTPEAKFRMEARIVEVLTEMDKLGENQKSEINKLDKELETLRNQRAKWAASVGLVTDKKRKDAIAKLEDFLFWQNQDFRGNRIFDLETCPNGLLRQPTRETRKSASIKLDLGEHPQMEWRKQVLNFYDDKRVGLEAAYPKSDTTEEPNLQKKLPIPPGELHLWNPLPRQERDGIEWSDRIPRYELDIDLDALEEARKHVEDTRGATASDPEMTHSKRRLQELELLRKNNLLPTRSLLNLDKGKARTTSGLWISAAETPDDWLTSFGGLDRVATSWVRAGSPESHENLFQISDKSERHDENGRWKAVVKWSEEQPGRRELHAYAGLEPSSPVDSPPHSPVARPEDSQYPTDIDNTSHERYQRGFPNHYGLEGRDIDEDGFSLLDQVSQQPSNRNSSNDTRQGYVKDRPPETLRVPYGPIDVRRDVANMTLPEKRRDADIEEEVTKIKDVLGSTSPLAEAAPDGYTMLMLQELAPKHNSERGTGPSPTTEQGDDDGDLFRRAYEAGTQAIRNKRAAPQQEGSKRVESPRKKPRVDVD